MHRYLFAILILFATSCSPVSKIALNKKFRSLEQRLQDHTGFMLYDVEKKRELYSFQSNQYFTPASNAKILTFYTALTVLGDSIPGLRFSERADSLIFRGTGDPSFLYSNSFDSRRVFDYLNKSNKKLFLSSDNFFTSELGPGWAWDDYQDTLSAERSAFPAYGNYISITHAGESLNVMPPLFSSEITVSDSTAFSKIKREIGSNKFSFNPGKKYKKSENWKIPYKTNARVTAELLADTLKKKINVINNVSHALTKNLFSVPADSLYKVMMQLSDNFISEQLLLLCADVLSDSLKPEIAINFMKKNHLGDLPDKPVWVDGSGISRYNLLTPRSIVKVWEKIYELVPQERLFKILAVGGKSGTIKKWFKNDPPYIYGKTGTLKNNYCLSGYLVTKKGSIFIFSFMSNSYPATVTGARKEMETILKEIYTNY